MKGKCYKCGDEFEYFSHRETRHMRRCPYCKSKDDREAKRKKCAIKIS